VVAPPPAVEAQPVDAGAREPAVVTVMSLPAEAEAELDVDRDAELRALLVRDPEEAERRLAALETPTQWQLSILANFALRRGDRSLAPPRERGLPVLAEDNPVTQPGRAWVTRGGLPLRSPSKKVRQPLAELPLAVPLEVVALDGGMASVVVELASSVEFTLPAAGVAPDGAELPSRVSTVRFEGTVEAASLSAVEPDAAAFERKARAEQDVERTAALWLRALQLSPSEETRRGLVDAAFAAHRPSLVVTAALERSWARARSLELAWGCIGAPTSVPWVSWPLRPKQKEGCVTHVDARVGCPADDPRTVASRQAEAAARDALGLAKKPLVRLQVDGQHARRVFLATSEVTFDDPCADFRELKVAGWNATLRQLAIPPGVPMVTLYVPVEQVEGVEYEVVSAASLSKVAAWLRSRGQLRWTMARRGQLSPSQIGRAHV
jgi:hypothetical protein